MDNLIGKGIITEPSSDSFDGYNYVVLDVAFSWMFNYSEEVEKFVELLHAREKIVFGRQKLFIEPLREAGAAIKAITLYDLDGLIISPYKYAKEDASIYMQTLRNAYPNLTICLQGYRFPKLNNSSYATFTSRCDIVMPTIYWGEADNPVQQYKRSVLEWKEITSKNIYPIVKPSKYCDELLLYMKNQVGVGSVFFTEHVDFEMDFQRKNGELFIGKVINTEWLAVHEEPNPISKQIAYLRGGDEVKVLELIGDDIWFRHNKGWSCLRTKGKDFIS